jgi:hypothetical protein
MSSLIASENYAEMLDLIGLVRGCVMYAGIHDDQDALLRALSHLKVLEYTIKRIVVEVWSEEQPDTGEWEPRRATS